MGGVTVNNGNKRKARAEAIATAENRYVRLRTVIGVLLLACIVLASLGILVTARVRLTNAQLYATNRVRIQTVLNGLESGGTERAGLEGEYDQIYIAKMKNTEHYCHGFAALTVDDGFVREAAKFADVDAAAVIDDEGRTLAQYHCPYDFTLRRFAMLRACDGEDGFSQPFSVAYPEGTRRFFAKRIAPDRILVFAQDWTGTAANIARMTSWEAVLRGMISVDTVSIAVSLKDYSFLYNPIDDLTGKDALQNGVPIDSLGNDYEGELQFGGDTWCVVGRPWGDAQVFVMTRKTTDMANDFVLVFVVALLFFIFIGLVSVYGILITQDNIRLDKMPAYFPLIRRRGTDGKEVHVFNFNLTVAARLLPLALLGIVAVTGMSFYLQSINGLASIAYESRQAINEISNKLANNTADAEAINTEYKDMFLTKCRQIAGIIEENPSYVFRYDPEADNVHAHPLTRDAGGAAVSGLDEYGNVCYSTSRHVFLSRLCELNAIENISVFDEQGRIMATNGDDWYFVLSQDPADQSYPYWEILAEHRDILAQDLSENDAGEQSQYIGSAFYYYTVQNEDGSTGYVSRSDYEAQLAGTWQGPAITKHRGVVQINIAPERLRTVMETATLTYVADKTTIHGTGHTVILDNSDAHTCVYSWRPADIGKTAAAMGYSPGAFNANGEMYNGFETVNGERYFQTFKLVDTHDCYIGTAVPLTTVFATRESMALVTLWVSSVSLLLIFLYTCCFGEQELAMYHNGGAPQTGWRLRNEQDQFVMTMPSGKTRRVRTAASRWDADYIPWQNKTPEQKFSTVLRVVFYLFAGLLFLCILLSRAGVVRINAINYVYESVWPKGFNIFAMTNCVITLIVVFVVANLAEAVFENVCTSLGSRAETLAHLLTSVIHYGVALFAVFYTLYLCGLDTGSLIASAGILSLVIGLGAQSMIQDILAGVFIVFEGAFRVGDIVTIDAFRGTVLEIGLRTTKIQDGLKNVKIFSNSSLTGIINMTKEATFASIDVGVAYGTDLERLEEIFAEELPKLAKKYPSILDGPHYRGVSMLNASSVDLKIVAQCKEQNRIQLCRDLNREMFLLLKKYGVEIPFPQVTVSYLDEDAPTAPAPAEAQETEPDHAETPVS